MVRRSDINLVLKKWLNRKNDSLSAWPVRRDASWLEHVNAPQNEQELAAIQRSLDRGCPFGEESWFAETAKALGLDIQPDLAVAPNCEKTVR